MSLYGRILVSIGAVILGCWVLMALIGPWLAPVGPHAISAPLMPPGTPGPEGSTFWLGTDDAGRDRLSGVLWSGRAVLFGMVGTLLLVYVYGLPVALAATGRQRALAVSASAVVAVARAVPVIVSYVVLLTGFGVWQLTLAAVLAFAALPNLTDGCFAWRQARSLAVPDRPGRNRIMIWMLVDALRRLAFYTAIAECLGFLGIGPWFPPVPGFGWMVAEARIWFFSFPQVMLAPMAALGLLLLGLNLLASGLEELVPRSLRSTDPAKPGYSAEARSRS